MNLPDFYLGASIEIAKELIRVGKITNDAEFVKNNVGEKAAAAAAALTQAVKTYWMEDLENEESPFEDDDEETTEDNSGSDDSGSDDSGNGGSDDSGSDTTDTTETDGEGG